MEGAVRRRHGCARASRVPMDVRQTFLGHAKQSGFQIGRETRDLSIDLQFNLNPDIASLIAIVTLPMLSSIIYLTASKSIGRFGAGTIVSVLVVGINIFANIIPSQGMLSSILPWYSIIAILPALIADIILHNSAIKSKLGLKATELIAGILVSLMFYIFNYPMLTWAFAIPLDMPIANQQGIQAVANLTSNFLSTLPVMLSLTLVPAALMGLVGALFVSKTIAIPNFQNQQLQQQQQQHSSKFIFQEKGGTRKRIY